MRYLVAIDGSEQSFEAVRALAYLSPCERAILLHALELPKPAYPMMVPEAAQDLNRIVERDMREEGQRLLDRVISILPEDVGPMESRLEIGTPAEAIVSSAERERIELIVMGARGLSPAKEIIFGSVSHRVATYAPCAVLTVPAPMAPLRKVLLAVEGREDADTAIRFFMNTPFRHPVEVAVLTVLPLSQSRWVERTEVEPLRDMMFRSAHRFVEDVAARLSKAQCCAIPVTKVGTPAAAILQHAEELQPDLIMIGSHTGTSVSRFLLGSVSHKILHASRRPVLTLR
jgi:nucleotide-binding universal stress UspA family protein